MKNLLSRFFKNRPENQPSNVEVVSDAPAQPTNADAAAFFTAIEKNGMTTHLAPTMDGKWSFVHIGEDFRMRESIAPTAFEAVKATHHFVEGNCFPRNAEGINLKELLGSVEKNKISIMACPTNEPLIYNWGCFSDEYASTEAERQKAVLGSILNDSLLLVLPDEAREVFPGIYGPEPANKSLVEVVAAHPAVSAARVGLLKVAN